MSQAYIKPHGGIVQDALKVLKVDFDLPSTAEYIPGLWRAAALPNNPATAAWSPEIYHRIGEWYARHGDPGKAHEFFEQSLERFDPAEALGPARDCRDFAKLHVSRGRFDEAFAMFAKADEYHDRDRPNHKGQRQQRVTKACQLEARVAADDDRADAIGQLLDQAMYDIGDFCLRDQHDRVTFLLPYAVGTAKQALHVRQLEINAARRRPIGTAVSLTRVVVDKELQLAGALASTLSKGVSRLPRPW